MEWDGISWQPQDIFRDMHQGLKGVEVKVAGFSESVVSLTKVKKLSSFSQQPLRGGGRDLKARGDHLTSWSKFDSVGISQT